MTSSTIARPSGRLREERQFAFLKEREKTGLESHWRTLLPHLKPIRAGRAPRREVRVALEDPVVGQVWISGSLRVPEGARELLVLVHGLGGSSESPYCRMAALEAEREGLATFSISLRGADRRGEDFYNIALTADLHAAIGAPELREFESIDLLGFSMGGHVALTYACEVGDQRVRSVAALCTPLDLEIEQRYFDEHLFPLYRRHVLQGLKSIYMAVAARREVPSDPRLVQAVETVYEWDRLTIAPRYGFESPEAYYHELSVARRLPRLRMPALLLALERDPIVPQAAIRAPLAALDEHPPLLDLRWIGKGGHVALASDVSLGMSAGPGLVRQVSAWMRERGGGR